MKAVIQSKLIHLLLGFAISIAIVIWLILEIDWEKVGAILVNVEYLWFIPITVLFVIQFCFRALRWRFLLPDTEKVPFVTLYDGLMLGNFGNFILPLRAGEFFRPFLIMRKSRHSFSTCFVSVVIERFFDLSCVLISFGVLLQFLEGMPDWVYQGAKGLSTVAGCILIFIILGIFAPKVVMKMADFFLGFLPEKLNKPLRKILNDFLQGACVLKNTKNLFAVIALTAVIWLITFFHYYVTLYMFDIERSFLFSVTIAVILALAVAAPSAPGFIGVFQVAIIAAFALFDYDQELGTSFAILSHLHQYVIIIAFGIWVFIKYNLAFSDLKKSKTAAEELQ